MSLRSVVHSFHSLCGQFHVKSRMCAQAICQKTEEDQKNELILVDLDGATATSSPLNTKAKFKRSSRILSWLVKITHNVYQADIIGLGDVPICQKITFDELTKFTFLYHSGDSRGDCLHSMALKNNNLCRI